MPEEDGVKWRLERAEKRIDKLEDRNVGILATKLEYVEHELADMRRTLTWVLRTFVGLAGTILAGALIVLLTKGHP